MKHLLYILYLFLLSCDSDGDSSFSVTLINENPKEKMMIFSHHLDLNQFTTEDLENNIYGISNPAIFGVDCPLIYDDNYKTLIGYNITTPDYPDGTGEGCSPLFINSIMSIDNQYLSDDLSIDLITENTWDDPPSCTPPCVTLSSLPGVVPNPYIPNNSFSETGFSNSIRFIHLPESCTINILDGNQNIVNSIIHNSEYDSSVFWFIEDEFNDMLDSGIYFYQVFYNENQLILNDSFVILTSISE